MRFDQIWHGTLHRPYRLHLSMHGEPGKPVVVLLHGIAASGESWDRLVALLEPDYFCITIDLLGFGRSPKPQWASYTIDQHIRSLRHAFRGLRISGDFILVGHSMGALLATNYARRHPAHIQRLVLLSPPVYPPLDTIEGKLALKRTDLLMRLYRALRKSPRMTPANVRRLSKVGMIPPSIARDPATWIPFKRSLERCIEQQTILSDIRETSVPVDAFYGSLDSVVIGENVRSLAKMRAVRVHSFHGGHSVGRAASEAIARLLDH